MSNKTWKSLKPKRLIRTYNKTSHTYYLNLKLTISIWVIMALIFIWSRFERFLNVDLKKQALWVQWVAGCFIFLLLRRPPRRTSPHHFSSIFPPLSSLFLHFSQRARGGGVAHTSIYSCLYYIKINRRQNSVQLIAWLIAGPRCGREGEESWRGQSPRRTAGHWFRGIHTMVLLRD